MSRIKKAIGLVTQKYVYVAGRGNAKVITASDEAVYLEPRIPLDQIVHDGFEYRLQRFIAPTPDYSMDSLMEEKISYLQSLMKEPTAPPPARPESVSINPKFWRSFDPTPRSPRRSR
jgi:hypothetical protein